MPIISVIDNKNNRWNRNAKKQKTNKHRPKKKKGEGSYSERVKAKWFCV